MLRYCVSVGALIGCLIAAIPIATACVVVPGVPGPFEICLFLALLAMGGAFGAGIGATVKWVASAVTRPTDEQA